MSSGHHLFLDDAAWNSPWSRRRVRDKAVLVVGLLLCAVTLPPWPAGLLAGCLAVAAMLGPARVPGRVVAAALALPISFIVVGAATAAVSVSWNDGLRLSVTAQGAWHGATLLVRGVAGTSCLMMLATTTPMVDVLAALRRVRVPAVIVDIASLTYRMVFMLLHAVAAMIAAQTARLGYTTWRSTIQCSGTLAATVLVRSWEHSQRLEEGLRGRGYDGHLTTLEPPRVGSPRFLAVSVLLVVGLAGLAWWGATHGWGWPT